MLPSQVNPAASRTTLASSFEALHRAPPEAGYSAETLDSRAMILKVPRHHRARLAIVESCSRGDSRMLSVVVTQISLPLCLAVVTGDTCPVYFPRRTPFSTKGLVCWT